MIFLHPQGFIVEAVIHNPLDYNGNVNKINYVYSVSLKIVGNGRERSLPLNHNFINTFVESIL